MANLIRHLSGSSCFGARFDRLCHVAGEVGCFSTSSRLWRCTVSSISIPTTLKLRCAVTLKAFQADMVFPGEPGVSYKVSALREPPNPLNNKLRGDAGSCCGQACDAAQEDAANATAAVQAVAPKGSQQLEASSCCRCGRTAQHHDHAIPVSTSAQFCTSGFENADTAMFSSSSFPSHSNPEVLLFDADRPPPLRLQEHHLPHPSGCLQCQPQNKNA